MSSRHMFTLASVCGLAFIGACAELEKERLPVVTTDGPSLLDVGESALLTATTANGRDASYAWTSADESIATVAADGTVTALGSGETVITATGADTGAAGRHVLVVVTDVNATIPFFDAWQASAHADAGAPAFTNWDDEGQIPTTCARCHSSQGLIDYAGGDGSPTGQVDSAAPTGSVIDCKTCHNAAVSALTDVTFPSGATVEGLGPEARCMTCHQGRASGADVDSVISAAGTVGDDTVDPALGFTNVHYYPAGATLYAGVAAGGYQYDDQVYDVRFRHVPGFDTCVGCHDAHSLQVKVDACATCHTGATDNAKLRDIRMIASRNQDYDGDGNTAEGIAFELQGLRETLLTTLRSYAAAHGGALCYGSGSYPYWFT
ncbi:MAG TPA: Ig-like domain-containing protein, partial [Myxococcota bacterium]|nr:Ig-like domain-containing protein [Myxococcota bacterium]